MNLDKVKELIDLMNANDLTELEIEEEGTKVRIRKGLPDQEPLVTTSGTPGEKNVPPPPPKKEADGLNTINAPMVGTFYRSPGPEEPPHADVGDEVTPETIVCIIEAMKVMNEIKAGIKGEVVEVLVENGAPVEFGSPLFAVRPS